MRSVGHLQEREGQCYCYRPNFMNYITLFLLEGVSCLFCNSVSVADQKCLVGIAGFQLLSLARAAGGTSRRECVGDVHSCPITVL